MINVRYTLAQSNSKAPCEKSRLSDVHYGSLVSLLINAIHHSLYTILRKSRNFWRPSVVTGFHPYSSYRTSYRSIADQTENHWHQFHTWIWRTERRSVNNFHYWIVAQSAHGCPRCIHLVSCSLCVIERRRLEFRKINRMVCFSSVYHHLLVPSAITEIGPSRIWYVFFDFSRFAHEKWFLFLS